MLVTAALKGDVEGIRQCLREGTHPDDTTYSPAAGRHRDGTERRVTPLMAACANGHVDAVKVLIAAQADLDLALPPSCITALTAACLGGSLMCAEVVLAAKADVNASVGNTGGTALSLCSSSGRTKSIEWLLQNGADINVRCLLSGHNALDVARASGHKDCVRLLVEASVREAKLQASTTGGKDIFDLVQENDAEGVRERLRAGDDPNLRLEPENGGHIITILELACKLGHVGVVKVLIARGATVNEKLSPHLLKACCQGASVACINELIKARANVNSSSKDFGMTSLHASCGVAFAKGTQRLLAARSDPNARDRAGLTPLARALHTRFVQRFENRDTFREELRWIGCMSLRELHKTEHEFAECVSLLLAYRANPNERHVAGNASILLAACSLGNSEVVSRLIRARADIHGAMSDKEVVGFDALHVACKYGHFACASVLLAARAKPDGGKISPLGVCLVADENHEGKRECVAKLLEYGARDDATYIIEDHMSPINVAVVNGNTGCMQEIIAHTDRAARLYNSLRMQSNYEFTSRAGTRRFEIRDHVSTAELAQKDCLRPILERQLAVRAEDSDDDDDPERTYAFPPPVDLDAYAEACRLPPAEETEDEREARFQRERNYGL